MPRGRRLIILCFFMLTTNIMVSQSNDPPVLSANSRQSYCPFSQISIAPNFSITDSDDTGIDAFFIQISSGYAIDEDRLLLTGNHPNISAGWNRIEGKLTLRPSGGTQILYSDLIPAVRAVVYESSVNSISGEKFFSFNVGDANFLSSTNHFYEYVPDLAIDWESARQAAANRTYFGLQGYLATISSQEEAQLAGKQVGGAGWIGGSDAEDEGVWKWVTGPEAGTVFWNGGIVGSSPNFAFWNGGEPNNLVDEDYAHITDPSVGVPGSWNDLPLNGDPNGSGPFQPKGYVVEYGGMPGDPILNISASTSIYIPEITDTTGGQVCLSGSTTLTALSSEGDIIWFDAPTGGNLLATGMSYTTPVINTTTTYYATVSVNGCLTGERTPIQANVNLIPEVTEVIGDWVCGGTGAVISANVSNGQVVWYDSPTSTTPIFIGSTLITPPLFTTTTFYVEASNGVCDSSVREPIIAFVEDEDITFELDEEAIICLDVGSVTVGIRNPSGAYSYRWRDENGNPVSTSEIAVITEAGTYTVTAITSVGCISEPKIITVRRIGPENFSANDIEVDDTTFNNSIRINTENLGSGTFEFALDNSNGPYQTATTFQNISPGLHTLYVKYQDGCGPTSYLFSVLDYPSFFTPNNDGRNDVWQLAGIDRAFYTVSDILVFNRFGILVAKINAGSGGWDGNYQGKPFPSSDYWFSVKLIDINGRSVERVGHFSLLRR